MSGANSESLSNEMASNSTIMELYKIVSLEEKFGDSVADPVTSKWFLMQNSWPTIIASLAYMIFSAVIGPWYMKNRKPYYPRNIILLYNAFQIVFSFWLFYEIGTVGWFSRYKTFCEPLSSSNDEYTLRFKSVVWWFFMSKFTEFLDTFFMVLRKKNELITALHVIHHGFMPLSIYGLAKFSPTGHGTLVAFINPLVHFVMYSYYFIAALGPDYQKYIWWKKYLTWFQMAQFITTWTHSVSIFYFNCNYPRTPTWGVMFLSVLFLSLFANYYINERRRRALRKLQSQSSDPVAGPSKQKVT